VRGTAEKHIPLAKKIPGVRKYEISKGGVATPGGPAPYHLIAVLHFDNRAAIQKAFGSAEGQAAVADVPTFATGRRRHLHVRKRRRVGSASRLPLDRLLDEQRRFERQAVAAEAADDLDAERQIVIA
jgi:uncharacterized protein (TIGR02118 family)